ncbi:MAG: exodeoxyribonuclease V subunit beta, partial [Deltaproteobacteria bacterium]|nr:exodeoxyribonuclease V subunit beta [Deltaproteobacteria bacterium]
MCEPLNIDGRTEAPFHLWFVKTPSDTGKPIPKSEARPLIARAVAAEIARLLRLAQDHRALLGKRPLSPEDIAVLVRTNAEARLMKDALSALNIPSVLYSTGNLFEAREALEVQRLLAGIVEPTHESLVRTALATDLIGLKAEDLDVLIQDDRKWEAWVVRFKTYRDLWERQGFVHMFRRLLFDEKIIPRLMALPNAERRATNVLHLCEVLHQASVEKKLGMAGLVKWLCDRRNPDTAGPQEHPLRLESDERAVRLVTIHKSKGLEYPVVFCPFTWDGSIVRNKTQPVVFHDEANGMRLTMDLGSQEQDKNRYRTQEETLAENLRLLYVALTRAKARCYLVWGQFNKAETSAPAYVFHQPSSSAQKDLAVATANRFAGMSKDEFVQDLRDAEAAADGAIKLCEMSAGNADPLQPPATQDLDLVCQNFSGAIDATWRITSFSALVSNGRYRVDSPDYDAPLSAEQHAASGIIQEISGPPETGILAFPRGTRAGR